MSIAGAVLGGFLVLMIVGGINAARDGDAWQALVSGYTAGVLLMTIARLIGWERDNNCDDTDES